MCSRSLTAAAKYRHRYHGVFVPNNPLRLFVTTLAIGRGLARVPQEQVTYPIVGTVTEKETDTDSYAVGINRSHDTPRIAWAKIYIQASVQTGGRSQLTSNRRFTSRKRPWMNLTVYSSNAAAFSNPRAAHRLRRAREMTLKMNI